MSGTSSGHPRGAPTVCTEALSLVVRCSILKHHRFALCLLAPVISVTCMQLVARAGRTRTARRGKRAAGSMQKQLRRDEQSALDAIAAAPSARLEPSDWLGLAPGQAPYPCWSAPHPFFASSPHFVPAGARRAPLTT